MPKPKNPKNRHGKRAPGMTMLGVPMPEAMRKDIRELATDAGHTSASWARVQLGAIVRALRPNTQPPA
jgi:hypothetical protein